MKSTQTFLVFTFFLFSIFSISAQYGNNGFGGNNNGRGGYGAGGGMNQMNQSPPEKPKEIPVEVTVGNIMERMKTAVNLDALQVIAISNVFTESIREQGVLLKQNNNQEDLEKNFKALSETTDRKINQFLNPDQKEKYIAFKVDSQKPEKKKRKKEKE
jgi:hypothetical protein